MPRSYERLLGTSPRGTVLVISLRVGKVLLGALLLLIGLYLVGVNVALNTFIGPRLLNSHPEVVQISFVRAFTPWPGRIYVTGADVSGQDSQNQFAVTAEHAAITFTPAGIWTQDVTGTKVRGDGVTIRIRRRVLKMPANKELDKLPQIKGFPSPLKEDLPDVRFIGVRLQDIKARHVREIWVDDYHFIGDLDAEGGMYYKPRLAAKVYPSHIVIKSGDVVTGAQPVVSQLEGSIALAVDEVDLRTLSQRDLAAVSAALDLSLFMSSVRFANALLPKGSGLALEDGAAMLALTIKLDQGSLKEGTKLNLSMPHLGLFMPLFRARTDIELQMKVDGAQRHALLTAQLKSLVLSQSSKSKAYLRSKLIRIHGNTSSLDLTRTPALALRMELPGLVADDLTFANDYIPEDANAAIEQGAATLSGHLDLSTAKHRLSGELDLVATKVSAKNKKARLSGGIQAQAQLHELDLKSLSTDLSGSWVSLDDVSIFYDGKTTNHWNAHVDLIPCVLHPEGKRKLETAPKIFIKNLQPAVGVIGQSISLPWIAKQMADRENVIAESEIQLEKDTLSVTKLEVSNDTFSVRGQLRVTDLHKAEMHEKAFILLKIAGLIIGIDVNDKVVKPILINAQKWFDEQLAAAGSAASPSP